VSAAAEREVRIALLMKPLEEALEDRKVAAIARIEAEGLMQSTSRVLHGLVIRTRRSLEMLGLNPPAIPSNDQAGVCLWFSDVMGRINSLADVLRQRRQTEGERIVEMVGYTILPRVHHFPQLPARRDL
jgi:hypothetical protein